MSSVLRDGRLNLGIKLVVFADLLGIDHATLSRAERGQIKLKHEKESRARWLLERLAALQRKYEDEEVGVVIDFNNARLLRKLLEAGAECNEVG